jgi:hypothetical protein
MRCRKRVETSDLTGWSGHAHGEANIYDGPSDGYDISSEGYDGPSDGYDGSSEGYDGPGDSYDRSGKRSATETSHEKRSS